MDYQRFLERKAPPLPSDGMEIDSTHPMLFDFQSALVRWSLRKGRSAIFADCGLGKGLMQVEWARHSGDRVLIVCPLAVAEQTVREGVRLGVPIRFAEHQPDEDGVWITNYQKLHKFNADGWDAIVLDESSILKSVDGKTRTRLLSEFSAIPRRLCCTATPAPNDLIELTNHAEFLGVMKRAEMLATWFVHDSDKSGDGGWRLKGHAVERFWRWIAGWAIFLRSPSDLGFDDREFILPALTQDIETVESGWAPDGELFHRPLRGVSERASVRKVTAGVRVERAVEIINATPGQWLVWCNLNDEGRLLAKALGSTCALIEGSTPDEDKVALENLWRSGAKRTLITKPSMFGFGLNWQHCHNVLYLGLSDSYEQYYQSVRRCWRFGQREPVQVRIVSSDAEMSVVQNVLRKCRDAEALAAGVLAAVREGEMEEIGMTTKHGDTYAEDIAGGDGWELRLGDSIERIREIPSDSVGLSVFSPPFASLYTYSASDRDLGNSKDYDEFFVHFGYLIPELLRVTKPGRRACVHVQQVTTTKVTHGVIGWRDFRADVVRAFVSAGWIYDGEIVIDKDPQAQAIRTKSKALMFVQKNKDSAWSRPAMADYILLFRKDGENEIPVETDVTNEEWILWARPIWYGIRESETLNAAIARDNKDERHVCPLQLETIERCIRLWTNDGETVLDPFAGIGSTGYVALQHGRKFTGLELKDSYWRAAVTNLRSAQRQQSLFAEDIA